MYSAFKSYFLISTMIFTICGCICKKDHVDCPALHAGISKYLAYSNDDNFSFVNDSNQVVSFDVSEVVKSEAKSEECRCKCDCNINGYMRAYCNNCDDRYMYANIRLDTYFQKEDQNVEPIHYNFTLTFLDYNSIIGYFNETGDLIFNSTNQFYSSLEINDKMFNDIYVLENPYIDSAHQAKKQFTVKRIYYNLNNGFIGFDDEKSGSTFVIQ